MESVDELYADWFESKDTDFMELFNDDLSGYGGTLPSYLFEESTLFKKRLELLYDTLCLQQMHLLSIPSPCIFYVPKLPLQFVTC